MSYFARKIGFLLIVLVAVTFLAAALIRLLPGDPATVIAGASGATEEELDQVRADLGLDDPLPVQYVGWLGDAVQLDLGRSYISKLEVRDTISDRAPVSFQLMLYAQIITLLIAVPLGVFTAYKAGTRFDRTANGITFAFLSLPNFVLGFLLIYLFAVKWNLLPASDYQPLSDSIGGNLKGLLLPALSLGLGQVAVYSRLLRVDMIATLQEDYVTMAKAKGLPIRRVLWRHALRPSSLGLLTVVGVNVGSLIGGAVVVEQVFQIPGVGLGLIGAIQARDYIVLQGLVAFVAIVYVLVNFSVDVLYAVLDPRVRHARASAA